MKLIKWLKGIIYLLICFMTYCGGRSALLGNLVQLRNLQGEDRIIRTKIVYVFVVSILIILDLMLVKMLIVLRAIEKNDQFNYKNVKRLKLISVNMWIMAILWVASNIVSKKGIIIDLKIMAFFIMGVFTQILSYVFYDGCKLKESEKTLKQENKLTI